MWVFPLGATLVSVAFSGALLRGFGARRRPHLLAWGTALAMFAAASLATTWGLLAGWSPFSYRVYYLLGAITNVPVLGLGTLYLFGPRRAVHAAAALVAVACLWAAGQVATAPLDAEALKAGGIPAGSEVMPDGVRSLSRLYSFAGFAVVLGGSLWSSWNLSKRRTEQLRRLAVANALIAAGTIVVAVASGFARYGAGSVFAVGLLAGISIMFAGFLKTRPGSA